MNYAEVLKKALTHCTLENLFKEFLKTIEYYSCLTCISEKQFYEVAEILKEKNRFYLVNKDDEEDEETIIITTEGGECCFINKEIKKVQNGAYWIEDCDNEDFQVLLITDNGDYKFWMLPIFFEEFYSFCEGINNIVEETKETSTNKKEICNALATKIAKNLNGVVTILKEFENVENDTTINFLTELFNAYLSN